MSCSVDKCAGFSICRPDQEDGFCFAKALGEAQAADRINARRRKWWTWWRRMRPKPYECLLCKRHFTWVWLHGLVHWLWSRHRGGAFVHHCWLCFWRHSPAVHVEDSMWTCSACGRFYRRYWLLSK